MFKNLITIILIVFFLTGCLGRGITTTYTDDQNRTFRIESSENSIVEIKKDGDVVTSITVNNRGENKK